MNVGFTSWREIEQVVLKGEDKLATRRKIGKVRENQYLTQYQYIDTFARSQVQAWEC